MYRRALIAAAAATALVGCGSPQVRTVVPTGETIAFLNLDPSRVRDCVSVEAAVSPGSPP